MTAPLRVLLLYSDTGGGHRSAAQAIREALETCYGPACQVDWVDALKQYGPFPFNRLPKWYPTLIGPLQFGWSSAYHLSNHPAIVNLIMRVVFPYVRSAARRLLHDFQPDILVNVHPLLNRLFGELPRAERPPLITIVTDLVTIHAFWLHPKVDHLLLPTAPARTLALRHGLRPEQIRVVGLPVEARFAHPPPAKSVARAALGWPTDLPTVLLMSGGEGVGPLAEITQAIAASGLRCQVAVVAGRNAKLKATLTAAQWPIPVHVFGFVTNVPDLMAAADVLVTKAGPGTITEALNLSLPLLLCSRIGGQEEGNVDYVVQNGAGYWVPTPQQIVAQLRAWFTDPSGEKLRQATTNAHRLAYPQAATDIAHAVMEIGAATRRNAPPAK